MADKLILATTGKRMLLGMLPFSAGYRGQIVNMAGTNYLAPSSGVVTTNYRLSNLLTDYHTATLSPYKNVRNSGSSNGTPVATFRITPSTATELTNGYFADLSLVTNFYLTMGTLATVDNNTFNIIYSNSSSNTEAITINSLVFTMTNDVIYSGQGALFAPADIITTATSTPARYDMMAIISLLVLEEPIVLEPGQSETRTITYDLSNV